MVAATNKGKSTRLTEYRRKRDFARTREPEGSRRASARGVYVIQKHAASHLHFDFRLELHGVLKSWAVPKGPSLDPGVKRLAVEVEDHPLEYAGFEGTIPQGQYGGGTVIIWDRGKWSPIGDPGEGLAQGKLRFVLHGKRLNGGWSLVRIKARSGMKPQWLLRKIEDEESRSGAEAEIASNENASVKSGRTIEELAERKNNRVWQNDRRSASADGHSSRKKRSRRRIELPRLAGVEGVRKAASPRFTQPQLATLVDAVPPGDEWLHEIKFDGYRLEAIITKGKARLITRRGLDWTDRFPDLAASLAELPVKDAVLDGEAVVLDDQGVSRFQLLQVGIQSRERPIQYFIFDLLHLNGWDLRRVPLADRKRLLAALLAGAGAGGSDSDIRCSEHLAGSGAAMWENACRLGAEGIISKRADGRSIAGRTTDWRKVKCLQRQEFVVGGYTSPRRSRSHFGSLLLGYHQGPHLRYAGRVGTGFDEQALRGIHAKLKALEQEKPSFEDVPRPATRGAHWVRPKLVAEIEFTEWTSDGLLRHPVFQGLREDKKPTEIVREVPMHQTKEIRSRAKAPKPSSDRRPARRARSRAAAAHDEWPLTHPERIVFPGEDLTKRDLAAYYLRIADHILPYIVGRPLSLLRCPEGQGKPCFMQRHIHGTFPPGVRPVMIRGKKEEEEYVMIDGLEGLMGLVQMGVLEIHPWGSRALSAGIADYLVFDLDPGPGIEWKELAAAARLVRDELEAAGMQAFVRTSGGKGVHVLTPLPAGVGWPKAKELAKTVAQVIAARDPKRFVATMSKAVRNERIFIDYLRNDQGATAIAPYSTRARPGAPVAVPIAWSELGRIKGADVFHMNDIATRLERQRKDPWADFAAATADH